MNNNSTATREIKRKKLAEALSAIMKNPETPEAIYNAIGDVTTFYASFLDYDSPEVIEMALKAFDENGDGRAPEIKTADGISAIM